MEGWDINAGQQWNKRLKNKGFRTPEYIPYVSAWQKFHLVVYYFQTHKETMKTIIQTIATLGICFLSFQSAKAVTGDINGQVIEKETMSPVAFAEITFDNGNTKTVVSANEYGYYSVKHMTAGKYQMSVKYNNRTFVMNKVRIQDSFTSGVNFMVSNNGELSSTVEVELLKKDNSAKAKSLGASISVKEIPVNPIQAPAKAPQATNKLNLYVNPVTNYTKMLEA